MQETICLDVTDHELRVAFLFPVTPVRVEKAMAGSVRRVDDGSFERVDEPDRKATPADAGNPAELPPLLPGPHTLDPVLAALLSEDEAAAIEAGAMGVTIAQIALGDDIDREAVVATTRALYRKELAVFTRSFSRRTAFLGERIDA